jgi:acyl-CoA thioesterase
LSRDLGDAQGIAQACADSMWADDVASRSLGMALDGVGPGRARMSMTVTAQMVNGHNICHGGYIFLLADSCFAFACNSHNQRAVAQHCNITFVRPARLGMRLSASAEERGRSGRSGIYDITVTAEDGAVIAELRGHSREMGQAFFKDPE